MGLLNPGQSTSGKYQFNYVDLLKACRTSAIVGGSAFLVALMSNITSVDFDGPDADTGTNAIVLMVLTFFLDGLNRYWKGNKEEEKKEDK